MSSFKSLFSWLIKEDLYYIRTQGYSGNSLLWWRPNSQGYTSCLWRAGKYTREEAEKICRGSSGTELAYLCDKVEYDDEALFLTVHADYLGKDEADIDYRERSVRHGKYKYEKGGQL